MLLRLRDTAADMYEIGGRGVRERRGGDTDDDNRFTEWAAAGDGGGGVRDRRARSGGISRVAGRVAADVGDGDDERDRGVGDDHAAGVSGSGVE